MAHFPEEIAYEIDDIMPAERLVNMPVAKPVYEFIYDDELDAIEKPEWLIEGILPTASLSVIYGKPAVGKTFLALDWALSIAEGGHWHSRKVKRGEVAYVCAEGWRGVRDRVGAWKQNEGLSTADRTGVAFLGKPIRLLDAKDVRAFGDSLTSMELTPSLIIIDTLARNAVGLDENSARDMGQVVSSCDELRVRFDCAVMLLHHPTKGGEYAPTLRGSSALGGALDTLARFVDDSENKDVKVLRCEKQKDSAPFKPIRLKFVPVGSSVILAPEDGGAKRIQQEGFFPSEQQAGGGTSGLVAHRRDYGPGDQGTE